MGFPSQTIVLKPESLIRASNETNFPSVLILSMLAVPSIHRIRACKPRERATEFAMPPPESSRSVMIDGAPGSGVELVNRLCGGRIEIGRVGSNSCWAGGAGFAIGAFGFGFGFVGWACGPCPRD